MPRLNGSGVGRNLARGCAYSVLMLADSDSSRDLVIVFSDGLDTESILTAHRASEAARRTDAAIYGVTAGGRPGSDFVKGLVHQTGGESLRRSRQPSISLQKTFAGIVDEFRRRRPPASHHAGATATGWHRLQVRVSKDDGYGSVAPEHPAGITHAGR